jgi:hypothetical protein
MQPRLQAPRAACFTRAPNFPRLRPRRLSAGAAGRAASGAADDDGALLLGAMPLVGFEPAVALAGRLLPGIADAGRLHAFLLLRRAAAEAAEEDAAFLLDFLPVAATSPSTAAILMSGGSVAGVTRVRPMSYAAAARLDATLRPAGGCDVRAVLSAAAAFNAAWGTRLSLAGGRNCADYRTALLARLRADGLLRPPE